MTRLPNPNILRLGAGAGYAGDRIPPAVALAQKGQLDYLILLKFALLQVKLPVPNAIY